MGNLPRRLPLIQEERIKSIVNSVAAGSAEGATRFAQPVKSSGAGGGYSTGTAATTIAGPVGGTIPTIVDSLTNSQLVMVDGKNRTFVSATTPVYTAPATPVVGDLWIDTANQNVIKAWDGSAWVVKKFGTTAIDDLAITNAKIAVDAIQGAVIAAGAITNAKIGVDAIQGAVIAAGAITTTKIADDAISTPKIAAGAVTATEIAAGAITTTKIAAGAVTATEISAGAITTGKIAAGAVTATEIAAGAVTAAKIAAGTITATEISASYVYAGTIAANKITSGSLAAGVIYSGTINANQVNAGTLNAFTITGSSISGTTITSGSITISGGNITTSGGSWVGSTGAFSAASVTLGTGQVVLSNTGQINIPGSGSTSTSQWASNSRGIASQPTYYQLVGSPQTMQITSSGVMGSTASRRDLKKDIAPLTSTELDPHKILDIPVRQFRWKPEALPGMPNLIPGFIADEVATAYPAAAVIVGSEARDWDFRTLIPGMVALLQEQDKRLGALEKVKK